MELIERCEETNERDVPSHKGISGNCIFIARNTSKKMFNIKLLLKK